MGGELVTISCGEYRKSLETPCYHRMNIKPSPTLKFCLPYTLKRGDTSASNGRQDL